jgi:hypothetical protein|tara:strand:+ start:798 stop:965 length:168 start_codon:yes stop_codon:yes gene_type:complete
MASLLDHSFPNAPEAYEVETFQRILRDIEMALTKINFPPEVAGKDDTRALTWFMD